jgi:DNA polymerase III alpha subunit (gram-positive type)
MPRFVCLDFETNGFPSKKAFRKDWPLPFSSYPIQVSVDITEDGTTWHEYDSLIRGATQFVPWVREHVPVQLSGIWIEGKELCDVIADLANLLQEGDTIVAHNASFDLDTVLGRTTQRLGIDTPELRRILTAPRFCTMRCAYSKVAFNRQPKLKDLCEHFEVVLERAHDATGDSAALAACVAEALRRGVMI